MNKFTNELYRFYLSIPIESLPFSLLIPEDLYLGEDNPVRKPFRHLFEDEFKSNLDSA